jgi:hypothetical protein
VADVAQRGSSQHGIGDRVEEHIGIAVPGEPRPLFDDHAAQHKRARLIDAVDIFALPDAHH